MRVVKEHPSDDWMPVLGSTKLAEHFRQSKYFPIKTLYRGVLGFGRCSDRSVTEDRSAG